MTQPKGAAPARLFRVRISPMEGPAAPREFEIAVGRAISAPEAFGASFEEMSVGESLELGGGLETDGARQAAQTLARPRGVAGVRADPRAAIALIEVLAARFRESA